MAEAKRQQAPITGARGAHIVVIEGRYYDDLNDMLRNGATAAIAPLARARGDHRAGRAGNSRGHGDPRQQQPKPDGFVALGVVIRGETTHYDIVSVQANRALIDFATTHAMPFGNAILTVENEAQAEARANPAKGDKGGDAARAALTLVSLKRGNAR